MNQNSNQGLFDKNNIIQMLGKILSHQGYTSPVNPNQDILNNIAKNFTAIKCVSSSSPVSTQFTDQVPSIVKEDAALRSEADILQEAKIIPIIVERTHQIAVKENEGKTSKKHNNKVGDANHSYRIDVRMKAQLRKCICVVRDYYIKELKGKGKKDKFFKCLKELLLENFPELCKDEDLFYKIYSPICKMICRKRANTHVTQSYYLTKDEKQRVLNEIEEFKATCGNFSIAELRRKLCKHPIIRLAKTLIYKNEIYKNDFWGKLNKTRKKTIDNKTKYEELLHSDLKSIEFLQWK